jgi:hypothetical protein
LVVLAIWLHVRALQRLQEKWASYHFSRKKFTLGPCGARIGCAWYSWKACGIHSSLHQKKKMGSNYLSSHKQPKQRTTNFLFQGNLGVIDS